MSMTSALRSTFVAISFAWAGPAIAAALEVTPVVHELAASKQALSMTVANRGAGPATLQVRAFHWAQVDGEERLSAATDVVLSPAIFSVEAGRSQTVRALFAGGAADRERSYRILIDELPQASDADPLRFALRLSIPVFQQAAVATPASLGWRLEAGSRRLVATNGGGRRERVRELLLVSDSGTAQPGNPGGAYLLAGTTRSWALDPRAIVLKPGDRWTLRTQTDAGPIEVPLVVSP